MIDNTALQACPFCGGEAQTIYALYDQNQWHVYCKKCGVNAPGYGSEAEAIAAWNRRAEPANEPLIAIKDAAEAIQIVRSNGGCPPDKECAEKQDCYKCLTEWLAYRRKPEPEGGAR